MTLAEALRAMMLSIKLRKDWNAYADRLVYEEQFFVTVPISRAFILQDYIDPVYVRTGARRRLF